MVMPIASHQKDEYEDILVESARSLCTRFRPQAKKSFNHGMDFAVGIGDKVYDFPVIIDNMMNLELLFHASKVTGDESFRKVAISHAEQVMHHQVRRTTVASTSYIMIKNRASPSKERLLRDIQIIQPGHVDKLGESMDLPCVTVRRKTNAS